MLNEPFTERGWEQTLWDSVTGFFSFLCVIVVHDHQQMRAKRMQFLSSEINVIYTRERQAVVTFFLSEHNALWFVRT